MTLVVDVAVRRGGFEVAAAFAASSGETVALLGPNGSGKSTLVEAIAGLAPVDRGHVELGRETLEDASRGIRVSPERRRVGVVFQDRLLFPHLSAVENVAFPLRARGVDRDDSRRRAAELLERMELGHRAQARPRELSGGEAQRVALARALVAEPELLLLDEPLSALDVGARVRIRDLVREELNRFNGVRILVTHDPVEASTLADRLMLLEAGAVTQTGTPEQIRSAPRSRYAADLVGVNAFRGRLEALEPGASRIVTPDGDVVVPRNNRLEGLDVVGILRPSDVTLSPEAPAGSARNVLRARVASVAIEGDRGRIRLTSTPPLVADVTVGSIDRLGLRPGTEVWASFKAVEVDLLPL